MNSDLPDGMTQAQLDQEREDVENVLFSAYCIILDNLLQTRFGEQDAHKWLGLTAQGMGLDEALLAAQLHEFNERRMLRIEMELRHDD